MTASMKKLLVVLVAAAAVSAWPQNSPPRFTVQFGPSRISWNPHYAYTTTEAQIFTALYEGLVIFHPATLRPVPGAAESWIISDEGREIRFRLRKDLVWSNGDRLNADDFLESWLHVLSPEVSAEYASLLDDITGAREYRMGEGPAEAVGIEAPDPRTLVVRLNQASPQFLSILCHYTFSPVHRDFRRIADWSALRSVPVNGPFIIRARNEDEILMDKNPLYWDADSVAMDGLRLLFLDDRNEVMKRFNRFDIDWAVSGFDASKIDDSEALNVAPLFSTTYYYFSNARSPWNDHRVRRALALLLPWDEIRDGRFIPAATLVPSIPNYPAAINGFPPKEEERVNRSRALLVEAGYPRGEGLPPITIWVPGEDRVARIMSESWSAALGLEVNIEEISFPDYYDSVKRGGYDIATLTWTGDYADPHTFLGMWESNSSFNEAGFSDPAFDEALREAAALPHLERFAKLKEAEDLLLQSGQVLPIEHYPAINLIDRRFVEGWFPNVLDIHPFKDIVPRLGYRIPGVVMR